MVKLGNFRPVAFFRLFLGVAIVNVDQRVHRRDFPQMRDGSVFVEAARQIGKLARDSIHAFPNVPVIANAPADSGSNDEIRAGRRAFAVADAHLAKTGALGVVQGVRRPVQTFSTSSITFVL